MANGTSVETPSFPLIKLAKKLKAEVKNILDQLNTFKVSIN